MPTTSKWLLIIAFPIIIIDQILGLLHIVMPVVWTLIAGPVMTTMLGIGILMFAIKIKI